MIHNFISSSTNDSKQKFIFYNKSKINITIRTKIYETAKIHNKNNRINILIIKKFVEKGFILDTIRKYNMSF